MPRAYDASWFSSCAALHGINVNRVFLPPYSPDLNPIENVWGKLKFEFLNDDTQIASADDLWTVIKEKWTLLSQSPFVSSFVSSMPERLDLVLRNDGFQIKY